jgi:hypothetical protein
MRLSLTLTLLAAASALHLEFASDYSTYSLTENGKTLFESKGVAVFADGKWKSQKDNTLNLTSHTKASTNDPVFGAMQGEKLTWSWADCDECMATSYMNYGSQSLGSGVIFTITFDHGLNGTSAVDHIGADRDEVITNFPAFTTTAKDKLPDTLSWQGSFVGANVGTYEKNSQGSEGGPTVFFDHADPLLKTVVIGSALNNFKSTSAGPGKLWDGTPGWAPGIPASIKELPAKWEQQFMLHAGSHGGITETVGEWGQLIQAHHASYHISDITLTNIGYQTDNGAYYCFCRPAQAPWNATGRSNCNLILLDELDYLEGLGVPMGYLSFQVHSLYTRYTLTIHSLYTHYTLTIHSLYTRYTLTIYSIYTRYTLTIHSLYTHYTLTIHSLYTHYTWGISHSRVPACHHSIARTKLLPRGACRLGEWMREARKTCIR